MQTKLQKKKVFCEFIKVFEIAGLESDHKILIILFYENKVTRIIFW